MYKRQVRAKAFYELMREKRDNEITVCFDLQQVQSLPKSPVQEAFYLRQLGFYALCVVDVQAEKPVFYTWTEDQSGRGSTKVSSALFHYLKNIDLTGVKTIRLFLTVVEHKIKITLLFRHCYFFWAPTPAV